MSYFLGVDIGGSKTDAALADGEGRLLAWASGGAGNPDTVGYDGMAHLLRDLVDRLLAQAGVRREAIAGAGFGVAGYDWPDDRRQLQQAIEPLAFPFPVRLVNDTVLGLLAGTSEGWGVAVVSGTGCNAWGWNRDRSRVGRVTGGGVEMGEFAGASELVFKAQQAIAYAWTQRGPQTALVPLFVRYCGARDLDDLLAGLMEDRYRLDAAAAPLVFRAAREGDGVALDLIRWAGRELGELAKAVVRQLGIAAEPFEVVLIGSMFKGSPLLAEALGENLHALAPHARLVRLQAPPVAGALLLAMESAGLRPSASLRRRLLGEVGRAQRSPTGETR